MFFEKNPHHQTQKTTYFREHRLIHFADTKNPEVAEKETADESVLLYNLGNRVEELTGDKKKEAENKLKGLQEDIKGKEGLKRATGEIFRLNWEIKALSVDNLTYYHLLNFPDLNVFFDQVTLDRLDIAETQLNTAIKAGNVLRPIDEEELRGRAEKAWTTYISQPREAIPFDPEDELQKDAFIQDRMFKFRHLEQKERLGAHEIQSIVPQDVADKIKSILIEVRAYHINAVREYVARQFSTIYEKHKAFGWDLAYLDALKKAMEEPGRLHDNEFLESLTAYLEALEEHAGQNGKEREKLKDREAVVKELRGKFAYISGIFGKIAEQKEGLDTVDEHLEGDAERLKSLHPHDEHDKPGQSAIVKNNKELAAFHRNPKETLDYMRQRLNDPTISTDELQRLKSSIDQTESQFKTLEAKNIANSAKSVIEKLRYMSSLDEMVNLVETQIGKEHVEYVDNDTFEKNYRRYTEKGNMVFYQRGDHWKVIIDQEAVAMHREDKKMANDFRRQMTHELRHLEFDHDPDMARDMVFKYKNSGKWKEIKKAFVAKTKGNKMPPGYKGKKTKGFTVKDWKKDEDVVNELYAMQHDIAGHTITTSTDPFNRLCQLIQDADLMAPAVVKGFEGKDEEVVRGAEGGEGEGGEEEKPSAAAATAMEGMDEEAKADLEKNIFNIGRLKNRIEAIRKSKNIGNCAECLSLANTIWDYLEANPEDENIIDTADQDLGQIENTLTQLDKNIQTGGDNPLRKLWNQTTFLSLDDFIQLGKNTYEFFNRRHKRQVEDHAAKLGQAFFKRIPLPYMDELAADAAANEQKAEAEYVSEWEGRLKDKDAKNLLAMIDYMAEKALPSKDQLKAVLRVLAEKGRIDWRQPSLWKVLNRLQSAEFFHEGDPFLLQNPAALRQKMIRATGYIWDFDEYNSLDSKNDSSYESKKKEFQEAYNKMQGQLDTRMTEILSQHKTNPGEADPIEFEAIMEYAIINGKSHAENVMFNMIAGMASGLLAPDRGIHLDKHLNSYPALEWFTIFEPPLTQQDYQDYCIKFFPEEYRAGKKAKANSKFHNFFWTEIQNTEKVWQRVEKATTERGFDHDWSRGIVGAGGAGADTAQRFFAGRSGQKECKPTAAQNAFVGVTQWFDENAKTGGKNWRENLSRMIGWSAMADGIMAGVAFTGGNDIYTREESLAAGKVARETPFGHHGKQSAQKHRERLQQIMDTIDPVFFTLLRDKALVNKGKDKEKGKEWLDTIINHLKANYGQEDLANKLTDVDSVFKYLQEIVDVIVKSKGDRLDTARRVCVDRNGNVKKAL